MTLQRSTRFLVALISFAVLLGAAVWAQQSRWASAHDATAKWMISMEREWAEQNCTKKPLADFIADDFQGTAPDGSRYNKSATMSEDPAWNDRNCGLDDAKVRFFGSRVALIYGSEHSLRTGKDGKESARCLVWTDTWLKRNKKWQIVSAQDTAVPCPMTNK